ncbi:MAG: RNA pseudouridine synthase [Proteobacteria bacterium]|nr:RNA pseudouridine synthase [Pseudomonadota bacterium]
MLKSHVKLPVPVISSGKGWIAVDKPSGISVHNDRKNICSIISAYIKKTPEMGRLIEYEETFGIHPIHRLDRDTSGIILLACNKEAFRHFSLQFEERTIEKKYIALLHGNLLPKIDSEGRGTWKFPLSKHPGGRMDPAGKTDKQPSETFFKVLDSSFHYTYVACSPLTGRIHQIRRHAKLAGHPVVGDKRYGTPRSLKFLKSNFGFDRLALHAMSISINPLGSSARKVISSPEIPGEISRLFSEDKASSKSVEP